VDVAVSEEAAITLRMFSCWSQWWRDLMFVISKTMTSDPYEAGFYVAAL